MRKALVAMVSIFVVAALSTPVSAQYAGPRNPVPTTTPNYAQMYVACFQLALRRGQNVSRGDNYSRMSFIDQCLAGKIPF